MFDIRLLWVKCAHTKLVCLLALVFLINGFALAKKYHHNPENGTTFEVDRDGRTIHGEHGESFEVGETEDDGSTNGAGSPSGGNGANFEVGETEDDGSTNGAGSPSGGNGANFEVGETEDDGSTNGAGSPSGGNGANFEVGETEDDGSTNGAGSPSGGNGANFEVGETEDDGSTNGAGSPSGGKMHEAGDIQSELPVALREARRLVSPEGAVYEVGVFKGNLVHADGSISTAEGPADVYVTRYEQGIPVWTMTLPGSGYERPQRLYCTTTGDLVIAGKFTGDLILGDDVLVSEGLADGFIVALDAAGLITGHCRITGMGEILVEALHVTENGDVQFKASTRTHGRDASSRVVRDRFEWRHAVPVTH